VGRYTDTHTDRNVISYAYYIFLKIRKQGKKRTKHMQLNMGTKERQTNIHNAQQTEFQAYKPQGRRQRGKPPERWRDQFR
jgi:hypothetical protein